MSDLSSQPTPLQTIYNWYRTGSLTVNRSYQRKLVWTLQEKRQLIDSILKDYPIPLVLLAETNPDSGKPALEIMDGLQRLHTIVSFIEHGFSTQDGRYFNVDEFTRAKEEREKGTFTQAPDAKLLTRSEVSKILDYILPVSVIRHASETEVTDIFGRINSYGHRLSDQERRQAGLISDLAKFVRTMSSEIRGDVSADSLPLFKMPEVSIDLPTTKYGYRVQASEVFWVRQGILRSTELRDSLDEQAIADLAACILGEDLLERSKDALDALYSMTSSESTAINLRLKTYDPEKLRSEIKYCIELIDKITAVDPDQNLRDLIFTTKTTNSFPTVFSVIFLAIHELSFKSATLLADIAGAHKALNNVQPKLNTTRNALSPAERRKNINLVKGLIQDCFVKGDISGLAYGAPRQLDIENSLRRSETETPNFEVKQGYLALSGSREENLDVIEKVIQTAVGIANIGPGTSGAIFIGVADKKSDADRIRTLDSITTRKIGNRWVVGVDREAAILGISVEKYYHLWRDKFSNAKLSMHLKDSILGKMELCDYKGNHILLITVPTQKKPSLYNGKGYYRDGDQTKEATSEQLLEIGARF